MSGKTGASSTLEQSFVDSDRPSSSSSPNLPPLAAAFLISFDLKVGYTIAWKRSVPDLPLDGVVEFKSLPSGLHNIKEDLIYFVHEDYAGISAFVNRPATEAERNAHFIAVGILVPLSYGRLGRSWLYKERLQELAKDLVDDIKKTGPLEKFWEQNRLPNASTSDSSQPFAPVAGEPGWTGAGNGRRRKRALSTLTNLAMPGRTLTRSHPVLSVPQYVELFGPLLYPLHRFALLRKRILLVTHPPVHPACDYVYDISVFSTISSALSEILPSSPPSYYRLPALFTVGVHDIPFLSKRKTQSEGWIACTTDEILSMKTELYDYVVELPHLDSPRQKWPRIKAAGGAEVKATQRDLRRWRSLKRALYISSKQPRFTDDENDAAVDEDEAVGLLSQSIVAFEDPDDEQYDLVVEPTSWSALAYSGFIWWASAGEGDATFDAEGEQDAQLNGDLEHAPPPPSPQQYRDEPENEDGPAADESKEIDSTLHMELLAYFHRYTHQILSVVAGIDEDQGDAAEVLVGEDDIRRMGLDGWSEQDKAFVAEVAELYFGRSAVVRGSGIECCGVRIC